MVKDLWDLLNTDTRQLGLMSLEAGELALASSKSLIDLAGTFNKNQGNFPKLAETLQSVEPLVLALDSPVMSLVGSLLPFGSIGMGILKAYLQHSKKEATLSECVVVIGQAAYLESFQEILSQTEDNEMKDGIKKIRLKALISAQSQKLKDLSLNNSDASKTVSCFHRSVLANILGEATREQFPSICRTEIFIERVARNTHWHLLSTLASAEGGFDSLSELFRSEGIKKIEQKNSIQRYLDLQIAEQPRQQVFNEEKNGKALTLSDIYVSMDASHIDSEHNRNIFNLESQTTNIINDLDNLNQVVFIQGEPGHGKSVFCRMYADWVRRTLYPIWIPILIRLRDIELQPQLQDTLRTAINCEFSIGDEGWLTDTNTRYLFILDGFDELVLSQRDSQGLKPFLENISRFQRECSIYAEEQGHQIIVTGRPMSLKGYEYSLPNNLYHLKIQPMNERLQDEWLSKWEVYSGKEDTDKLRSIIRSEQCPKELKSLSKEPLLLYLLAVLAKSTNDLGLKLFDGNTEVLAKIQIYTKLIDFVLEEQRTDLETGENITERLVGIKSNRLRRLLGDLALCITQTETERISVETLKKNISDKTEKELDHLAQNNVLASFYFKQENSSGSIEFIHKSFREFLTAERLKHSFIQWTRMQRDEYEEECYIVPDPQLYEQIYDILGYGIVTSEITEYLIGLLEQHKTFNFEKLLHRLNKFYLHWSNGFFIEKSSETICQRKSASLQRQGIQKGQRQVDLLAGLNVTGLLFEICRSNPDTAQLSFHPCGIKDSESWNSKRLKNIIRYSQSIELSSSQDFFRKCLTRAKLNHADLSDVDLSHTNLRNADLSHANLRDANLRNADLSHANLRNAVLHGATLSVAKLSSVDLREAKAASANFSWANLHSANLCGAYLCGAILEGADLTLSNISEANLERSNLRQAIFLKTNIDNISWNMSTIWDSSYELHTSLNVRDELLQNLSFLSAVSSSLGYELAQAGQIIDALEAYEKSQRIHPSVYIDIRHWQQLCWHGCKHGYHTRVSFLEEEISKHERKVLSLEIEDGESENGLDLSCLQTRSVLRALNNDKYGAIEDLKAALNCNRTLIIYKDDKDWFEGNINGQRERCIRMLESEKKKFTFDELVAAPEEVSEASKSL